MQKNKNVYFCGKVLNSKEEKDDNAKTFAFSATERASLNMKGIPVHLEHEDNMKVGEILNSWRDKKDQFWVYGRIDNQNGLMGTFAKHAIQKKGKNKPYYTGLSLQHVHRQYKDGHTEKQPIEVSLTTDPRRPNTKIVWTSNNPSEQKGYKPIVEVASRKHTIQKETNMSSIAANEKNETPETTTNAPAQEAPVQENTTTENESTITEQSEAPNGMNLSTEVYDQLQKLYEDKKETERKTQEMETELKQLRQMQQRQKDEKLENDARKGRALMGTMIEHMRELLGADQTENLAQNIEPLMAANPEQMHNVMEIVSKASKRYKDMETKFKSTSADLRDKELELKFQTLIKQNGMSLPQKTTEVASKKRAAVANPGRIQTKKTAYNPYSQSGASSRRNSRGARPGMNRELLEAFLQNRTGGGRSTMSQLHKSLSETPIRGNRFMM